jgi:DNA invertase Pin-like site-specific DNA recombinase
MTTTAALLRVSSKDQDEDRQRNDVIALAKEHGHTIPPHHWFVDKESRDRSDHRPEFQRLLDLVIKGKVKLVIIQTFDRFGVSDEVEWFHFQHIFRKAGCGLVSVKEGDLFAKDVATTIQNFFRAKASEAELFNKSFRTLNGSVNKAKDQNIAPGNAPYGYDRAMYDANGRLLWTAHYLTRSRAIITTHNARGEAVDSRECTGKANLPKKGKTERAGLILSRDPKRADLIRYIFKIWTTETITARRLAVRLNAEGCRLYDKPFTNMQIEAIITQPRYLGTYTYNRTSQSHKHEFKDGRLSEVPESIFRKWKYQNSLTSRKRPQQDWISHPDWCPQIVDDETFAEAQRRLASRPRKCLPPRGGDRFLKGLLYCGECQEPMSVKLNAHKREVCYVCKTYTMSCHTHGKNLSTCGRNTISHKEALRHIQECNEQIWEYFADHETEGYIALNRLSPFFTDQHTPTVDELQGIDQGLAELGVNVADAVAVEVEKGEAALAQKRSEYERWIQAKVFAGSDSERKVIAAKVTTLEAEIAELERQADPVDITDQALAVLRGHIQKAIQANDPATLSDTLRRSYSRIVLHFRQERAGNRMRSWLQPERSEFQVAPNSLHRQEIGSASERQSPMGLTLPTSV